MGMEERGGKGRGAGTDMVEGIVDKYDALPSGFRHTLLLRHPAKVGRKGSGEEGARGAGMEERDRGGDRRGSGY